MNKPRYSLTQIEQLANGNLEFINQMVDLFIDLTPQLIQQMKFGMLESDFEKIYFSAHKLKLSIDMMGIKTLQSDIRTIEKIAKEKGDPIILERLIIHCNSILAEVVEQLQMRKLVL